MNFFVKFSVLSSLSSKEGLFHQFLLFFLVKIHKNTQVVSG